MVILGIAVFVVTRLYEANQQRSRYDSATDNPPPPRPSSPRTSIARQLRAHDRTFSEPIFLDWAQLLFTRFHEARGAQDLRALAPYLSPAVMDGETTGPEASPPEDIRGVIIGSSRLERLHAVDPLRLEVVFRANWTAVFAGGNEQAHWVEEVWTFSRNAGVRSRAPENIERLGCPSCGSANERTTLGRCAHCNNSLVPGESDWCVAHRAVRNVELTPPYLTGTVDEAGTNLPTIRQRNVDVALAHLDNVTSARFQERASHAFFVLQESWSRGQLDVLRAFETDALFSQHRFWLEEYQRQGLRNMLDDVTLSSVEMAKVDSDFYFDAITCRMRASARDYTVRLADRKVVAGKPHSLRHFTEYWTFIRRKGARESGSDVQCPSCMAPLRVSHTGVCTHCGTKLTRGDFDWVLSRIEQDEEYVG